MCEESKAEFVKKVEHYNNATFGTTPFVFPFIGCYVAKKPPLPIYATYLYDSVMLYSKALANVTSTINVNGEFSNSIKTFFCVQRRIGLAQCSKIVMTPPQKYSAN